MPEKCWFFQSLMINGSARSSYSHPDLFRTHHLLFQITPVLNINILYKSILATAARSKALSHHISWPYGNNQLATTWPVVTTWLQLATTHHITYYDISRHLVTYRDISWNIMIHHDISWHFVKYHDITWHMTICEAYLCSVGNIFTIRDERRIGRFEKTFHAVSGTVYAVGEDKLIIKAKILDNLKLNFVQGFNYDGLGPDAFFFAGTSGDEPSANGDVVRSILNH